MNVTSQVERRTYTVEEVATVLGISRSTAYEAVRAGDIKSLRFGRRIVVPAYVIKELTDGPVTNDSILPEVG